MFFVLFSLAKRNYMNHVNKIKIKKKHKNERIKRNWGQYRPFYKAINSAYEIIDTISVILESEYEIVESEKKISMDKNLQ